MDCRSVDFNTEATEHEISAKNTSKLESAEWLKLKSETPWGTTQDSMEEMGKLFGAPKAAHSQPPQIKDKNEDKDEDEDEEEGTASDLKSLKRKAHQVKTRATELKEKGCDLSVVGSVKGKKINTRLVEMLKVVNATKGHLECETMDIMNSTKKTDKVKQDLINKTVATMDHSIKELKKFMSVTGLTVEKAKTPLTNAVRALTDAEKICNGLNVS